MWDMNEYVTQVISSAGVLFGAGMVSNAWSIHARIMIVISEVLKPERKENATQRSKKTHVREF